MSTLIVLALGSNLNDRAENLTLAVKRLEESGGVKLLDRSSIYESEPLQSPVPAQNFYNAVIKGETSLSPVQLLDLIKGIEKDMGRSPGPRNAPRIIDIDILYYGTQVTQTPELVIPHPRLHEREFVLVPLCELLPLFVHPVLKKTSCELLEALGSNVQGRVVGRLNW